MAVSIAGVLHTAAPSRPGGTVNVCQRTLPVRSLTATTLPRAVLSSLLGPEVPMYTVPFQYTGLPKTLERGWSVRTVSHRVAPLDSDSATRRGPPIRATGTYTAAPPGARVSIAAVPFTGCPRSLDHNCFPLTASRP